MIGHPLKVREFLDEIYRGEVLLPEIQRSYVWKGPQVAKLLDSLYRDYPVGQILLWDTIKLPITKNLEGVKTPVFPRTGHPKIVLDGQQRLTSLFKSLGRKGDDDVEVYFNLDSEQFERYSQRLSKDPRWVSVRQVVNGDKTDLQILHEIEETGGPSTKEPKAQEYLNRLQRLRKIGEYEFPGTVAKKFEETMDEYSELDYNLDARLLIRCLVAIGTGQSRFRYLTEFWTKPPEEIQAIWKRTKKAIDSAVNFARHNARYETSEWLPSLTALVPLAAYFDKHKAITPNVEEGLLRWFYLASLRARYSGSQETALDEDLKALSAKDPIEALMKTLGPITDVSPDEFDDAGTRNPLFAMTYAAARKRGAKDWFTGVTLARDVVGKEHDIQIHHVFPKALLKKAGVSRKDRDEIANLAFLAARPNRKISNREPGVYLAEIADKNSRRLEAQFIPMDKKLWRLDRFQDFLATRREMLATAVNDLIRDPV